MEHIKDIWQELYDRAKSTMLRIMFRLSFIQTMSLPQLRQKMDKFTQVIALRQQQVYFIFVQREPLICFRIVGRRR